MSNKTPKIRFAGFSDNWEVRKLSELATMHARIGWQNLRTSEFLDDGEYMLITGTDFEDGKINFSTCHYVEKERYEQDRHIQITNGSLLITKDGTLGKVAYVENLSKPATLNAGIFNVEIKNEKETDRKYLFQYLKAPFLMNYVEQNATGGTIKHLNQNILVKFDIVSPTHAEQERIGQYFSRLDDLIGLYKRKLEKSLNFKKAMLAKMFPQNGKPTPQIRFAGFNDNWEVRKLGEVADFNPKSELPKEFEYVDLESVVGTEMISHRTETKTTAPSRAQRLAKTGDIFFQMVRPYQKNNYLFLKPDNNYVFSTGYAQIRPHIETKFVMSFLQTENFVKMVLDSCTGTSYPAINSNDLANLDVSFSPTHAEQQRIGEYFSRLDDLIGLYKRKLEKSLNLKKAMLEKMFP